MALDLASDCDLALLEIHIYVERLENASTQQISASCTAPDRFCFL